MCSGYGKIIRLSDGRMIRCPKCFGPSNPAPTGRPPAEILERKQRASRKNKTPGKLRRALRYLWEWIFNPLIFLWEGIFAALRFLWKRIFEL